MLSQLVGIQSKYLQYGPDLMMVWELTVFCKGTEKRIKRLWFTFGGEIKDGLFCEVENFRFQQSTFTRNWKTENIFLNHFFLLIPNI